MAETARESIGKPTVQAPAAQRAPRKLRVLGFLCDTSPQIGRVVRSNWKLGKNDSTEILEMELHQLGVFVAYTGADKPGEIRHKLVCNLLDVDVEEL